MTDKFVEIILQLVAKQEISEKSAFNLIKEYKLRMKTIQPSGENQLNARDIAIIGISCRFPQAANKEEYWRNLINGVDGIRDFPDSRFARVLPFLREKDKESYLSAGYLDDIETFDAEFFNILPGEAKYMDPQQRIFMETGYEAIEDAGYGGERICNSHVGVYVGFSEPRYKDLIADNSPAAFIGNFPPIVASRLSYALNLTGPALSVATACSSSMVALHLACEGLLAGDCDMALVGGVTIGALPGKLEIGNLGITSAEGRSRSFDAAADGTGWGEGCGVVLIKRLDQAEKDQDHIYSIIKASAINQNGTSNGLASPNARAQEEVLVEAWKRAGIDPMTISYMEAHGTGTKIGDPIEVKGITNAFRKYTHKKQFCGLGSVKSNIGHIDSASGMAGLIKIVLAMQHKKIPPTLHFAYPNPLMSLHHSPLYVNTTVTEWKGLGDEPLRAGVSSFGLSGTNCHVVLEEYRNAPAKEPSSQQERMFTLSARSEGSLRRLIGKYVDFLRNDTAVGLDELCYVLNTGRGHYQHRLAIPVSDLHMLEEKLQLVHDMSWKSYQSLRDEAGIFTTLFGEPPLTYNAHIERETTRKDLLQNNPLAMSDLARRYVAGELTHWPDYYPKGGKKVPVPTYAWEKKRYWVDAPLVGHRHDGDNSSDQDFHRVPIGFIGGYVPTSSEYRIGAIWGNKLGLEQVDVDEDFFQMGGDSLLATDLVVAIAKEFATQLTLADFFGHPTIRGLAALLAEEGSRKEIGIVSVSPRLSYPVSSAQRRQYILNQLDENNISYNMPGAAYITGPLDMERFRRAFDSLITRHESFRTVFEMSGDEIVQIVRQQVEFVVEYSEVSESDTDQLVTAFIRPFRLEEAPLLRVRLQRLLDSEEADPKHLFLFDIHHMISDGVSMEILLQEFVSLYEGRELPPLRKQSKDYAVWQYEFLQSERMKQQEDYWMTALGIHTGTRPPVLAMPYDYPRPPVMTFEGDSYSFMIETTLTDKLKLLGLQHGATLYMTLLAVYKVLLYQYTRQEDIVVGSLVAGRRNAGLGRTIGLFTNFLPIRSFPIGNRMFTEFLKEVRQKTLEAYDNQDYPFEKIVEKFDQKRDISRNPIFDTMIILHNQGVQNTRIEMDRLVLDMVEWKRQSSTLDLKLDLFQAANGQLSGRFEYYDRLFQKETIIDLAKLFVELMDQIVETPELTLMEYRLFTPIESVAVERKRNSSQEGFALPPITPAPHAMFYPLSFYQKRIWETKKNLSHFIAHAQIIGNIDRDKIKISFEEMQAEDESLRTTFVETSSIPYQQIHDQLPLDYTYTDCSDGGGRNSVADMIAEELRYSFNAMKGSLCRVRLIREGNQRYHIVVVIHSLIAECIDTNDFLSRLFRRYRLAGSGASNCELKPVSVVNYACWQHRMFKGHYLDSSKAYWDEVLGSPPLLQGFPVMQAESGVKRHDKGKVRFTLTEEELKGVQWFANDCQAIVTEVLLTGYLLLLRQLTQSEQFRIGLIRPNADVIGNSGVPVRLNYIVPLLVDVGGISSFHRLLESVATAYRTGVQKVHYPFSKLLQHDSDAPTKKDVPLPLYQLCFAEEDWTETMPGCRMVDLQQYRPDHYALQLTVAIKTNGIECIFTWDTALLEASYVESLSERYQKVIGIIAQNIPE
ncbi:condensation domain-containing protein [Paenibacillus macquariensis]|uniref:Phosphopantetheine attachment site n=1 Tax=Paenibacillus macquariensis TaxID=948756 RepID=A0ABY1K2M0_9BACL|nr:condensation domain-containing protein [Paenibacillus macquariensis]MEC0090198.1 condensation domain-containing protein [Paenibacillus macquariensis]OAB39571.1 hypothetical protein PMSM_00095 [Paenibacillus macquariensis subsp. macquariensis]SIR17217.1 Phosphopantetheine attachment site [Paenibacillus macquariensis]